MKKLSFRLRQAGDLENYNEALGDFFDKPKQEIENFIEKDPDSFAQIIFKEIINFDSYGFLDKLMIYWDDDPRSWLIALDQYYRVISLLIRNKREIALATFERYHKMLLTNLDSDIEDYRSRIAGIYGLVNRENILSDNYLKVNELILMEKISNWRPGITNIYLLDFIEWVFSKEVFQYNEFDSEIKGDFPNFARKRVNLLKEY